MIEDQLPLMVRSAPGARCCCDAAGRLCAMARSMIVTRRLVMLAVAHGEGTPAQVEQRIVDMLAAGLLIED